MVGKSIQSTKKSQEPEQVKLQWRKTSKTEANLSTCVHPSVHYSTLHILVEKIEIRANHLQLLSLYINTSEASDCGYARKTGFS